MSNLIKNIAHNPITKQVIAMLGGGKQVALPSNLGEKITFVGTSFTATTGAYAAHATKIATMPIGKWLIIPSCIVNAAASATMLEWIYSTNSNADNTGNIDPEGVANAFNSSGIATGSWYAPGKPFIKEFTAITDIYGKAISYGASRSVTFGGFAMRIND